MSVIQVYLLYYSKVYSSDGLLWKKGFVIIPHEDQVIQSIWIFLIYNEFWLMKLSFRNQIPFTPTQIEAIRSGMQPGLTMVVGPPGTGKTDVAVQIISNIYHNFPDQRTLIVTHSNQVKYTHTLCSLIFLDVPGICFCSSQWLHFSKVSDCTFVDCGSAVMMLNFRSKV